MNIQLRYKCGHTEEVGSLPPEVAAVWKQWAELRGRELEEGESDRVSLVVERACPACALAAIQRLMPRGV